MKKIFLLLSALLLMYGCAAKPKMVSAVGSDDASLNVYVIDGVISFAGNYADIKTKYPYSYSIINEKDENGISSLLSLYTSSLCNAKPKYFTIAKNMDYGKCSFDMIETKGKPFAPAISIVIDREDISIIRVANKYKITAIMALQILSVDMVSSGIISSVPLYFSYVDIADTYEEANNPELHKKMFKEILTQEIPVLVSQKLEEMIIRTNPKKRIAVTNVTIDQMKPKSLARLHKNEPNIETYKIQIANLFTQMLSNQLHVPFLPYMEDATIGKMTLSFANSGKTSSFKIPKSDYDIQINMQGFRVDYKEFENKSKLATYAAFTNITAEISYLEKTIFDCDISTAVQNPHVDNFETLDERDSLYRAVREMAYEFSENIYAPKNKWLKTSISCKNNDAKKSLKELSVLFDDVRAE